MITYVVILILPTTDTYVQLNRSSIAYAQLRWLKLLFFQALELCYENSCRASQGMHQKFFEVEIGSYEILWNMRTNQRFVVEKVGSFVIAARWDGIF